MEATGTAQASPTSVPTVTANGQWKPVAENFDGVEMVLVPPGCFTMGTASGGIPNERPTTKICFDKPFWIDRNDVTNAQFTAFGGVARHTSNWKDANRPRESIRWIEARDFCAKRGARLPTEAEWEYAARGPDNLIYPWGNDFVADNVVYAGNSSGQTADVGSKPGGASWVGALDMSGNVEQWVSSIYKLYPYAATDGRESDSDTTNSRVHRGGAWDMANPDGLRSADRYGIDPSSAADDQTGFRCARSV
jgi:iron(II)-dependent oxidoreductase